MNITAGIYNKRKIEAPDENITRPTLSKVRMSVFNTLYSIMDFEGKSFLDMFGGSGIMGLEAISRGFSKVIVVEKNQKSALIIKNNYQSLGLKANLLKGDSLKLVQKLEKFDVAYIDPPYFSGIYEKSLEVVNADIVILEHVCDVDFKDYKLIKQKKYGDKFISFLESKIEEFN